MALYNSLNNLTCESYMIGAGVPSGFDYACRNSDFTNVTDLKFFVNATWYNDIYSI